MTIAHYGIDIHLVLVISGFIVIHIVENIFITPKLIGPKFGLNPLMSIFSLVVSAYLFGVVGMILAIPLGVIMKDIWLFINKVKGN
jgi:predicted PurR-regulated permease PerM